MSIAYEKVMGIIGIADINTHTHTHTRAHARAHVDTCTLARENVMATANAEDAEVYIYTLR